ncbi:short-chain dehydrogenase/reductase SDR [Thermoproteus uzoniensis 768-20]|uniref:Short-chain dehydrogenase/reductase SDR n=1 Tax=Thermoproteus uzoniensis (strain 768-20) TaxID=999630 RepID=F2L2K9_THEU7|nr:SDR family oxidoreductase [Thermoproteus uzoniensis]AEA13057.1 short-chain dehydrogenase/reductase SDR [Thermoproteus uzoniensis 768-20]
MLKGKTAIVTAASRGIGRGVARVLAREGANLVIASRDLERLSRTASEIRSEFGAEVVPVQADLTKRADVAKIVETAARSFGGVDILVYNTGPPKPGTFMELTEEDWDYAVRLLLMSAVWLTKDALPYMIEKRQGRIIYITSLTLKRPLPNLTLSNVIRLSIAGLVKTLAYQLAQYNILVNGVLQGYVETERVLEVARDRAVREGKPLDDVLRAMAGEIPLGRMAKPEEIGELVAFLASERASYITGSLISIDGGYVQCI